MQQKTKEVLEAWAKKAGFYKLTNKDVWVAEKCPNQKIIDLSTDPIFVGINTGVQRIAAAESGIASIQDYQEIILKLYNQSENEKSPEAASHAAPPQEEVSHSPPTNSPNVAPVISGDEANKSEELPYICSACKTGITAVQRSATVASCKRALCENCASVPLVPNAPAKEEVKAPEPKPEPAKETKKKPKEKKKDEKEHKEEKIGEVKAPETPAPEQIKPVMCQDCGFELSHVRALEYPICEDCAEKRKIQAAEEVPLKSREGIKMSEKTETKDIVPAEKPGANAPAPMSDHERDKQIEKAKAKRFLENQGGSYKVNGNEIPDSAQVQNIANEARISVMMLESEQNEDFARVRVRGILKGQSVDDEVWVDFDTELKLLMMEFIKKNDGVLDHFDGLNPVFKEGAKIKNFDGTVTDAKYALVHAMLTLRKFAVRTAGTKAAKRVQMKLMNKEFREKEEIADEQAEKELIEANKRKR